MSLPFLHNHPEYIEVCKAVRDKTGRDLDLIEKDYWLMHVLYCLKKSRHKFELKGGTSLSKGWGLISRFSEDVDVHIHPPEHLEVFTGKNHDKEKHRKSREDFFDWLANSLSIEGSSQIFRDHAWDDGKSKNCGIAIEYESKFAPESEGDVTLKPHILLEAGFARVAPNEAMLISSWALELALNSDLKVQDNRALGVLCYIPEYTFVEKLGAITSKFRQEQEQKTLPANFIRHYYDVYQLLGTPRVQQFLSSEEYKAHKAEAVSKVDQESLTKGARSSVPFGTSCSLC